MKKLNKMLSVVLSLTLCASMVAPAFAASYADLNKAISSTADGTFGENNDIYASTVDGVRNVTLNGDVNRGEKESYINIAAGKEVTINLNGHNIVDDTAQTGATQTTYNIVVQGTLTVEGEGTIKSDNSQVITNYSNKSTLNLNGGTVEATGTGIAVNTKGTATISEGVTVTSGKTGVQVTGGTLETAGNISGDRNGIVATGNSSVTVTGGSVEGGSTNGLYLEKGATATIDGAATTVKGGSTGVLMFDKGTTLTVKDGTIEGGGYGISGNGSSHGTEINVLGGNVTGGSTGIYHPQDGKLTIGSEANGTGPVITGVSGNGVQMCAGEGTIYGGTIKGSGNDTTADKTGDGVIPDGSAVSLVSREYYGPANSKGVYSEPKVTIHTDHVTMVGGEATYQWANTEDPGNKPDSWTGDEATSGIFEATHDAPVGTDGYYTNGFIVIDPAVAPTTTSFGWTEGSHCSVCGHIFVPQQRLDMLPGGNNGGDNGEVEIDDVDVPLAGIFTRADAIGYLWEQSGSPEWELSDFEDVPEDHYWAVAIGWAQDMGIALPDEDGNFRPDDLVLRSVEDLEIDPEGELQEFLNRYAVYAGIELDEGELFIKLAGSPDDVIMGEEAQVIFDDFFAKLEAALAQTA